MLRALSACARVWRRLVCGSWPFSSCDRAAIASWPWSHLSVRLFKGAARRELPRELTAVSPSATNRGAKKRGGAVQAARSEARVREISLEHWIRSRRSKPDQISKLRVRLPRWGCCVSSPSANG